MANSAKQKIPFVQQLNRKYEIREYLCDKHKKKSKSTCRFA